ncbi:ThiF family adenylyltransferase [Mesorhizobium sp. WSM3876]|uniref:ThiF family adenylyltransferase n=1 Tax=Mesorhizobium sp. WSM3876 TaxID=422277 RepID=UPI001FE20FA3|nr:ThiF family adenylyltransferase [Mesorhizobium sp. WSM3876]
MRFPATLYSELCTALLADASREACAVAFARHDPATGSWVVAEAASVPEDAYERRDAISAVLKAAFVVEVANRARHDGLSIVVVHTHPQTKGFPAFSEEDDRGEAQLAQYFTRRAGGGKHLALVIGPEGCRARLLGGAEEISVWEVGANLALRSEAPLDSGDVSAHDRQVRAFGAPGQQLLRSLRIGVVGAGGTGSVLLQQLAHLGIQDFTLVEPDTVELTNLNRLVGAGPDDVGRPKVVVAARMIRHINPKARISALERDVADADVPPHLAALDFLFICTDSHASRAVVGQLAYQHLVPAIDMGVSITVGQEGVTHITGRVQMLAPGLPCLTCTGALNGEQIRRELLSPEQRAADPYVQGIYEPQPAVVSINSTMSSLAVTMFLGAVTPVPAGARFQMYDGVRGTVRLTTATRVESCIVCSAAGAMARAGSWPLPVRQAGRGRG